MRTITRLIHRIAIGTVALATTLALTGTPVRAATEIIAGPLYITQTGPCVYLVDMGAHVPMSEEDAAGYLYWGARVEFRIYGQDTWFDDLQYGPITIGTPFHYHNDATNIGVWSHTLVTVTCGVLNEDLLDRDEIFFQAKWIDADGGTLQANSYVITGDFHL